MKFSYLLFLVSLFFYACNDAVKEKGNPNSFGGTLKINEPSIFSSLFPHCIKDQVSSHMVSQIFEGLVKFDAFDLSVKPAVAERWEVDSTETTYRFFLHTNVYFHNDKCFTEGIGRKVTANDFVFSFTLLATQNENNVSFFGTIDNILGASEHYFANSTKKIQGVFAENDSVLIIQLVRPNPLFLYFLASPAASVIPREAFELYKYKSHIGCGPFYISHIPTHGEPLILQRNDNYYHTDKAGYYLPYLDSIIVSFNSSVIKELSMLSKGELDIVYNIDNKTVAMFLEKNIAKFKGETPKFILQVSNFNPDFQLQHILRRDVKGFITNSQNYYDLSKVYFESEKQDSLITSR